MKKVAIIMGSDSDWPVVKGACGQLDAFGIPYEAHILSAHRTPAAAADFAKNARAFGFGGEVFNKSGLTAYFFIDRLNKLRRRFCLYNCNSI